MTPTNRNRLVAVVALVLAGSALGFIAWGNLGENLVYYWSPSQLLAQGEKAVGPTIRLGGMVAKDSIVWNAEKTHLDFKVADGADGNWHAFAELIAANAQILWNLDAHACTFMQTCLVSRNASRPSSPSSRPHPLCLSPPKGHWLVAGTQSLMQMVPASTASARRQARDRSLVNA